MKNRTQTKKLNNFELHGELFLLNRFYMHSGKKNTRSAYWYSVCSCGNAKVARETDIHRSDCRSCGCLHSTPAVSNLYKARVVSNKIKYPKEDRDLYIRWISIKSRTLWIPEHAKSYKYYRGKGIKICDSWTDFFVFKEWAVKNGFKKELTIDRIDSNIDYSPENCRWVTPAVNIQNRGATKLTPSNVLDIRNSILSKEELSEKYSVKVNCISTVQRRKTWKNIP